MTDWEKKDKEIQMAQAYNCAMQEAVQLATAQQTTKWFDSDVLKSLAIKHYENLGDLKKNI